MSFWKDKQGNELTFKQFMQRWRLGLEGVTAYQQNTMQMWSTVIILIGIVCGIVVSLFAFKTVWWLTIILVGALFNTAVIFLGLWQKKTLLKQFGLHLPPQIELGKTVTKKEEVEGLPSFHNYEGGILE